MQSPSLWQSLHSSCCTTSKHGSTGWQTTTCSPCHPSEQTACTTQERGGSQSWTRCGGNWHSTTVDQTQVPLKTNIFKCIAWFASKSKSQFAIIFIDHICIPWVPLARQQCVPAVRFQPGCPRVCNWIACKERNPGWKSSLALASALLRYSGRPMNSCPASRCWWRPWDHVQIETGDNTKGPRNEGLSFWVQSLSSSEEYSFL